jgi:hypothetical protein
MKRSVYLSSVNFFLLLVMIPLIFASGAEKQPIKIERDKIILERDKITVRPLGDAFKKVIVSEFGEVTSDSRYIGEPISFRIYYKNTSKQKADITIIDELDKNLSAIEPLNDGVYNKAEHTIYWTITDIAPGTSGFVQFNCVADKAGKIENFAQVKVGDIKPIGDMLKSVDNIRPPKTELNREKLGKSNTVTVTVYPKPALGWIPFEPGSKAEKIPVSTLKDETTMDIMLNFDIPGMFVEEVKVKDTVYHKMSIPGLATTTELGKPELPIVGQIVEIPYGVNLNVEIFKSKAVNLDYYHVYPAQVPETDGGREINRITRLEIPALKTDFRIDKTTYTSNMDFPGGLCKIQNDDIVIVRGHRLLFVKANPVQYNPVTRKTVAYSQIEVRVWYNKPAQIEPVERRLRSEAFDELLESQVINFKHDDLLFYQDNMDSDDDGGEKRPGCDYLIIIHDDMYNDTDNNDPIYQFRDWKQSKGYETWVVDLDDVPHSGSDVLSSDIQDYIQDAYDNWFPAPTYVLLVGDSEFIPTNYGIAHPTAHNGTGIATDMLYTTVDGTDYFPDIYLGRLSVDTSGEAADVIDKIMNYEQQPPGAAAFYTQASLIAVFEDDTDYAGDPDPEDGDEDRPWIENMEEMFEYLDDNGYVPDRIYSTSSGFPGDPASDIPQTYQNGDALPAQLQNPGFAWDGDANDISNAINGGRFLVTYRDHGGREDWSWPFAFDNTDVDNLTNGDETPVIFSIACQNGWFDNETDNAALNTNAGDECFCEHFIRHNNGGAVAILGATRNSWTGPNDFFVFGLFKAIWPDFAPNPPLTGDYPTMPAGGAGELFRIGQIHNAGKMYMANCYNHDSYREGTFELYQLFGDPEMFIWTEEPQEMRVDYPVGIGSKGVQDFIVKVKDKSSGSALSNATVVFTKGSSIIDTKQTNAGGEARFTWTAPSSGTYTLTVTLQNYLPFMKDLKATASGGQINKLDPDNGVANQIFLVGGIDYSGNEDIEIYFDNNLQVTETASGGGFGQTAGKVEVKVPATQPLGPVNVVSRGKTSDRYAVDVFRVRSENPIDLYTYSQWDDTTWHLASDGNKTWNSPSIQLYDSGGSAVNSGDLVVGHTYTIKARIYNDTDFNADDAIVTFKWADFGLGQSDRVWTEIDPGNVVKIDVPAHNSALAEKDWTPLSTGHLCLLTEVYHIEDINLDNNKGQENCSVGSTASPAVLEFIIWNPTDKPAMIFLELRQLVKSQGDYTSPLWGAWIEHPDPQLIPPGGKAIARVVIDPDKARKVEKGQSAEFVLTGYINDTMIGGVNFIVVKK